MATRTATRRSTKALRPRRKPTLTSSESAKALRGLDGRYLECRDLKHAWKRVGWHYDAEGYRRRHLRCARGCTVTAYDTIGANGERVKPRRYQYPAGYKIGQVEAVDVRKEAMRRQKIYSSEAQMLAAITRKR